MEINQFVQKDKGIVTLETEIVSRKMLPDAKSPERVRKMPEKLCCLHRGIYIYECKQPNCDFYIIKFSKQPFKRLIPQQVEIFHKNQAAYLEGTYKPLTKPSSYLQDLFSHYHRCHSSKLITENFTCYDAFTIKFLENVDMDILAVFPKKSQNYTRSFFLIFQNPISTRIYGKFFKILPILLKVL